MNKQEMVEAIAQDTGLSKVDAKSALNSLMINIKAGLKSGQRVKIVGFGSFKAVRRAARMGHNPKTLERISIPEKNVVKYIQSGMLKV